MAKFIAKYCVEKVHNRFGLNSVPQPPLLEDAILVVLFNATGEHFVGIHA